MQNIQDTEEETDFDIAVRFAAHIDNPCVEPRTGNNIRDFYLREAKELIKTFKNQYAIDVLEAKIREYS